MLDQIKKDLLATPLSSVVHSYIFYGDPYVFSSQPAAHEMMLNRLSEHLGATTNNISVVGSAKTGFSVNPDAFPRSFPSTPTLMFLS